VPGADLEKVHHYFKEGHPYFQMDALVIGGKNSAIDAALELNKAGAQVTVVYRGDDYSSSIKPWILPEFTGLVKTGEISMMFDAHVEKLMNIQLIFSEWKKTSLKNDVVFNDRIIQIMNS
jgi:thioredoxin reductase (NADPH)